MPVGGGKDDGPEIRGGAFELKRDVVKLAAVLFDANDAAAHFGRVFWIAEDERLADVKV